MTNKVWVKTKYSNALNMEIPHSLNIASAMYGFIELGKEIKTYNLIEDIYNAVEFGDIVIDYIEQTQTIFNKFGLKANIEDYPDCMKEFLHRKVWTDTINSISSNPDKWSAGWFVKPTKDKAFTGKIISSIKDLVGCGSCYEDYGVICSEPLDIKAEWRCFILNDEIIDIRPYGQLINNRQSWKYSYDARVVEAMLNKFRTWKDRPASCSMDIGVAIIDNLEQTVLIEFNDSYSLGGYGLPSIYYAKLIEARWEQLYDKEIRNE